MNEVEELEGDSYDIGAINNFENMSKQKFDTPKDYFDFLSKRLKKNN